MKKIFCLVLSLILMMSVSSLIVSAEPYWYPDDINNFENFHGENLPRVVDDADCLTDAEEKDLSKKVQEIVDKYGFGYVIFTDINNYGLSKEVYSADFLYYNGYGTGDNYDAVVFYLSLEEGNRGWRTTSINGCEKIFDADVCYDIDETVDADIRSGNYYSAFLKHVDFVDNLMQKRGRQKIIKIILCVLAALLVGSIPSGIRLHSLRKKMRVVQPVDARNYLVDGSFNLRDKSVDYQYTTVTKVAKPQDDDHSGGSSFSSGSASSGGSFSSGGRDF